MPTPISHFTIAYLIYKSKKTLSLPALIIGSITPDLDILVAYMTRGYIGRELLHSFIGVGLLGTIISTLLVVIFYPGVVSTLFGINKEEVRKVCKFSKNVLASSFLGGLSHILVDSTCHFYNPLFYPLTRQSIDVFLLTSDWGLSYLIVELFLIVLLGMVILSLLRRGTSNFWKRILVEN